MARRDVASIESMYEDRSASASKDYHHVRTGSPQWHHSVLPHRGNIWDTLYLKHQLRESNLTLDRVYAMLAEFLIELRLHEEQDKITQIVTGSSTSVRHSMYDEYVSASKGKVPTKGKGKQRDGKGTQSQWRPACDLEARRLLTRSSLSKVSSEATAREMRNMWFYPTSYFTVYSSSEAQGQECRMG